MVIVRALILLRAWLQIELNASKYFPPVFFERKELLLLLDHIRLEDSKSLRQPRGTYLGFFLPSQPHEGRSYRRCRP
jgi:hypothetical protein